MPIYAITGITGQVGNVAADTLLAAGVQVRAVLRSEAKAAPWRDRGAEVALAALDDSEALQAAFHGVDGIYLMTPTWFEATDMFAENAKALRALGQALRSAGAPKVVLLSSIGAHQPSGTGAIIKLHDMERAFADLVAVTSVRAAWFMENFSGLLPHVRETGILPSMLAPLDHEVPMIATADIGKLVAERLLDDWSGQHIIELEGPRRYAPNDVAAAFATVLRRPVQAQILPQPEWDETYRSWGFTPRSAAAMADMLAAFNTGWIAFEQGSLGNQHSTTSLEDVLAGLAQR